MGALKQDGNQRHAYVRSTTAATLPLVVDATHNQFGFNSLQYVIPSGSYATVQAIADAFNAAVADEDNVTTAFVNLVLFAEVSRSDVTKLKFTSITPGVNTQTFTTGIENDILATLIVSNATALADGGPLD